MTLTIFVVTAKEVRNAKFYSIIANKVNDAANKELSLVFRYVLISETIVDFGLGYTTLQWIQKNKIFPADMRGQCYDGAWI